MKLAVLIDAENISASLAEALFKHVAGLGEAPIRRIYGDFSSPALKPWSAAAAVHGLVTVQQFAHVAGKNSSDIAMVIDAMDLMHEQALDGICLVSSDSDFSRLAMRIRESGMKVYGFGKASTLPAFRSACHRHFVLEAGRTEPLPSPDRTPRPVAPPVKHAPPKAASQKPKIEKASSASAHQSFAALATRAMSELVHKDGWVDLAVIGSRLRIVDPKFASRTYGSAKLSSLFKACDAFDVDTLASGHQRIRIKPVSLPPQ